MSQPNVVSLPRVVMLAAVDRTTASDPVIEMATKLAQLGTGTELHLVHVVEFGLRPSRAPAVGTPANPTQEIELARELLDTRMDEVRHHNFGGRIVGHVAAGTPWREIVQLAANLQADVIVVGSHSREGLKRVMLGSVSEQVVRKAQCPVVVARPKDYHTQAVPEIEPPCPDCVLAQRESGGATLWCERHATHHTHGRLHYEHPKPFAMGSLIFRG